MFNGHMDTSYSGKEPWLAGVRGFQPDGFVKDGRIYGLGISNMKGALVRTSRRCGRSADTPLRGDVMVAAVCGEIEKTQWGSAQGAQYRGYAAGSRHLVDHGGAADVCILGEPTEQKVVLEHFGSLWLRLSTTGAFVHTAFAPPAEDNSIVKMRPVLDAVLEWLPRWAEETRRRRDDRRGRGRLPVARLADAAPHRPLPRPPRAAGAGDGRGAAQGARVRARRSASRRRCS